MTIKKIAQGGERNFSHRLELRQTPSLVINGLKKERKRRYS